MKKYTDEQLANRQEQGDVILTPVDALPPGAVLLPRTSSNTIVLQESEVSGHHHHFSSSAAVDLYATGPVTTERAIRTITEDMGKYIVVREAAELFHGRGFDAEPALKGTGDHNKQVLLPGIYEVSIVAEFCYDSMEPISVRD